MSTAPVVRVEYLRPQTPAYAEMLDRHRWFEVDWGIELADPTPELIERATQYTKQVQARLHNESGDHPAGLTNYHYSNKQGQIGAQLLADYLTQRCGTTVCGWDHSQSDPGFDIITPGNVRTYIDAKTRQAFLTLRPEEVSQKAEYYALVNQANDRAPYVFVGVITPAAFWKLQEIRPMLQLGEGKPLLYWASGPDLIPAKQFHPEYR